MALVYHPIRKQTYDHNPRGSATTHVTMRQDNPFDRRVIAKVRDLRGLDLGDATQTDPGTATSAPSGGFWGSAMTMLSSAAATVLPKLAATAINASRSGDSGPVPGTNPAPAPYVAPKPAMPSWVIPVGAVAIGAALFLAMRKKK